MTAAFYCSDDILSIQRGRKGTTWREIQGGFEGDKVDFKRNEGLKGRRRSSPCMLHVCSSRGMYRNINGQRINEKMPSILSHQGHEE